MNNTNNTSPQTTEVPVTTVPTDTSAQPAAVAPAPAVSTDSSVQPAAEIPKENITVVKTDEGAKDGQVRCPKCGATDISTNVNTGKLRCNYCRHEFEPEKVSGFQEDLSNLSGKVVGSGAQDIIADTKDIITLKCSSCGAEVVIDTASSTSARCHWCRNTLSINQQIPNGAVPDVVLPFALKKEDAQKCIEDFVGKRKFFANPTFTKEFTTNNIMGVFFPYMVVDANMHSKYTGQGEHKLRSYTVKNGDHYNTYYDADLYDVGREFDLTINGLTVESSQDKLNNSASNKTNNVINAIMPFDIENAVKWNSNFIKGFTSEKRDVNVNDLGPIVRKQAGDISRFAANETLQFYDRGVKWNIEDLDLKGEQWKAAYLPVWLYSYQQVSGDKKILHYVAVNARTKETMGSVPIHMPKLLLVSAIVEIIGIILMLFVDWDYRWTFLSLGVIFFAIMFGRYRNQGARHHFELETKHTMTNLANYDNKVKTLRGLSNARMSGANNTNVKGSTNKPGVLENVLAQNGINIAQTQTNQTKEGK